MGHCCISREHSRAESFSLVFYRLPLGFMSIFCDFERRGHNSSVINETVESGLLCEEELRCSYNGTERTVVHFQEGDI
jgi:hypothetical protein